MTADDDRAELLSNTAYGADDDIDDARSWSNVIKVGLALVLLASFVGLVWYAYNLGLRKGSESVAPVIQAGTEPIKVQPADPGGLEVPNQDVAVYEAIEGEQGVERYVPPPLAGESGNAGAAEGGAEEPAASAPPAAAPGEPAETASAAPQAEPAKPASEPDEPEQVASTPPAEETPSENKPNKPPTTAELIGPFRVQLAAFRTPEEATQTWLKLQQANKDLLGDLDLVIEKVDLGEEKGIFYRLQAAPLKSRDAAKGLCGKLQAREVSCLVVEA